jgi:hypothetical protein
MDGPLSEPIWPYGSTHVETVVVVCAPSGPSGTKTSRRCAHSQGLGGPRWPPWPSAAPSESCWCCGPRPCLSAWLSLSAGPSHRRSGLSPKKGERRLLWLCCDTPKTFSDGISLCCFPLSSVLCICALSRTRSLGRSSSAPAWASGPQPPPQPPRASSPARRQKRQEPAGALCNTTTTWPRWSCSSNPSPNSSKKCSHFGVASPTPTEAAPVVLHPLSQAHTRCVRGSVSWRCGRVCAFPPVVRLTRFPPAAHNVTVRVEGAVP